MLGPNCGSGLADIGFIAINLGGIKGPVAQLKGCFNRIDDCLALMTKHAEAQGWNRHGPLQG